MSSSRRLIEAAEPNVDGEGGRLRFRSVEDVAEFFGCNRNTLLYILYRLPEERKYATWEIPKRTGGMRRIDSPLGRVREWQDVLTKALYEAHRPHPASYGFLPGRGIVGNAEIHKGQRLVLNVDLADFFPSINFGRVRGRFMAAPFDMSPEAATVCAQLCTFRNGLPQGASTSPILSNFIASTLDRRLLRLARSNRMRYSRYADDITFSTNAPRFPQSIVRFANAPLVDPQDAPEAPNPVKEAHRAIEASLRRPPLVGANAASGIAAWPNVTPRPVADAAKAAAAAADAAAQDADKTAAATSTAAVVGEALDRAIRECGFAVNPRKVRLQSRETRQSVTGLTVNAFPNVDRRRIRRLRAMLHAWRKFGLKEAGREHFAKHRAGRDPSRIADIGRAYRNIVYGELAFVKMVRGAEDRVYLKLCAALIDLDPNPSKFVRRMVFGADDYDVFISHASEDKAAVARPIFEACEALGVKAFLDEAHIGWGENFTSKINVALGAARCVLVIVSDDAVRKSWPLAEINTALSLEVAGEKVVAPIIVGRPDLNKIPLIKGKDYMIWRNDPEAVARRLQELLAGPSSDGAAAAPKRPGRAAASNAEARGFLGAIKKLLR